MQEEFGNGIGEGIKHEKKKFEIEREKAKCQKYLIKDRIVD